MFFHSYKPKLFKRLSFQNVCVALSCQNVCVASSYLLDNLYIRIGIKLNKLFDMRWVQIVLKLYAIFVLL